jgi:hypothetical protein
MVPQVWHHMSSRLEFKLLSRRQKESKKVLESDLALWAVPAGGLPQVQLGKQVLGGCFASIPRQEGLHRGIESHLSSHGNLWAKELFVF